MGTKTGKNFTDLQLLIKDGGTVTLTESYTYSGEDTYRYGVAVSQFEPTIYGNGFYVSGSNTARGMNVQGSTYAVTINDLTFQNGAAYYYYQPGSTSTAIAAGSGGAIYNNGTVTATGANFVKNGSEYGGAIFNDGVATLTGGTFSQNIADKDGAGIFNEANLALDGVSFIKNRTLEKGGAIYNGPEGTASTVETSQSTVSNSYFNSNYAVLDGGAIYNYGTASITGSTFFANTAKVNGGAIENACNYSGDVYGILGVTNSTFTKNKASANGGAISDDGVAEIVDSYFEKNVASLLGGAVYIGGMVKEYSTIRNCVFNANTVKGSTLSRGGAVYSDGNLNIENSTFTGNSATNYGGAFYNKCTGTATISNSVFSGNKSGKYGGAIFNEGTLTITDTAFKTDKDTIYSKDTEDTTYGTCNAVLKFNGVISLAGTLFSATQVQTDDGYSIVMDISSYTKKNSAYIIDDFKKLDLCSAFSINVNNAQVNTTYKLAKNVSASQSFAILIDGEKIEKISSVKVGQSVSYANTMYSLAYASDGGMTLTVVRSEKLSVAAGQTFALTDNMYGMKSVEIKKGGTLVSAKSEDPACEGWDISMASGSSKFKMAASAIANLKNVLAGNDQTATQFTIGDFGKLSVAEEVSGVKSLSTGKYAQVSVLGQYVGTTASDTMSFGTNNIVLFGNVIDLKGGKNTVSIGKYSTATFQQGVSNITTLKTLDYSNLTGTTFNSSATNSSISLGKNSTVSMQSVTFQNGNDSLKLSGSTMSVEKIDFAGGTDTLSLGSKSILEVKDSMESLEKLTLSSGTADALTKLSVQSITGGTSYANNYNIGNYADVSIGDESGSKGIVFGSGKDTLKIGSNSTVKLGTVEFSGNTDTMSIGAKSKVSANAITGVTKLTLSAGSAENAKKQQPANYTSLVVNTLELSGLKDNVTLNGYTDLTIGKLSATEGVSNISMKDNSNMAITGPDTDFSCIDSITMGKNCVLGLNDTLYQNFDTSVITKQGKNCSIVNLGKSSETVAFGGFAKEVADNYCAASNAEVAAGENGWLSINDATAETDTFFNDTIDYFTFADIDASELSKMKVSGSNVKVEVWVQTTTGGAFSVDDTLVQNTGSDWTFNNSEDALDYRVAVSLADSFTDGVTTYAIQLA